METMNMIKIGIYLITIILAMFNVGELLMAEEKQSNPNEVQIILYQEGKQRIVDHQEPFFQELLQECEELFLKADSGYRLVLQKDLISQIKKKMAIEVIYSKVHRTDIPKPLYYTRLLIPLQEKFSNGTVFFAGIHEYELKRDKPDLMPEQNYSYVDAYRAFNYVVNTKGQSRLKETLKKITIKMDGETNIEKLNSKA